MALTVDWDDQSDDAAKDPVLDLADVCYQGSIVHYAVEDFARGHFVCVIVGGVGGLVVGLESGLSLDATHLVICESQCSFVPQLWEVVSAKIEAKDRSRLWVTE